MKSSCENRLMSKSFCKNHKKESHMIDQCEDFHNEVIHMLTQGILRIEEATSK